MVNHAKRNYRRAAGIEKPLVIKSALFLPSSFFVKRLSRFSLRPIILRRFFFSFSSSSTRAASDAVDAFLIPFPEEAVVGVPLLFWFFGLGADAESAFSVEPLGTSVVVSVVACFLRFFEPGAFLRE